MPKPTFKLERKLISEGYNNIAGVDEAGRGAWAGPLVAAAVVLDINKKIPGLDDSKQLTKIQRQKLFKIIKAKAKAWAVVIASHEQIDSQGLGIINPLMLNRAMENLKIQPDYVLIDGFALPGCRFKSDKVIKGDKISRSIAAASIVAKVTRDQIMVKLDSMFPGYGMADHKGYGTAKHQVALKAMGPCAIHRLSFRPVYGAKQGKLVL